MGDIGEEQPEIEVLPARQPEQPRREPALPSREPAPRDDPAKEPAPA